MAENKTVATGQDVEAFLASVDLPRRIADTRVVMEMMGRISGEAPRMWGPSLIGFGQYHYRYDSGREGDSFMTGLSPRKAALTIHIMPGFDPYGALLDRLGKVKTSKSCLYITRLERVDQSVLEELIARSYEDMKARYHS